MQSKFRVEVSKDLKTVTERLVPPRGEVIGFKDGVLAVPDNPIIPFVEGDGTGASVAVTIEQESVTEKATLGHFRLSLTADPRALGLRLDREQPLTFLEFNYMILQAYDFRELAKRAGCRLQMGGSDQWGNITAGIDLGPWFPSMDQANEIGATYSAGGALT